MTMIPVQCAFCRHFHRDRRDGDYCDAFPDGNGIPAVIIRNEHDHREPYPGDRGVRFEPVEDDDDA